MALAMLVVTVSALFCRSQRFPDSPRRSVMVGPISATTISAATHSDHGTEAQDIKQEEPGHAADPPEHAMPLPKKPMEAVHQGALRQVPWQGRRASTRTTRSEAARRLAVCALRLGDTRGRELPGEGRRGMGAPRGGDSGIGAVGAAWGHSVFTA